MTTMPWQPRWASPAWPAGWRSRSGRSLQAGERVLVLGATGTVGSVAVQAARLLGASRVVAAGRDSERLARSRELGADETVHLGEAADMEQAFREAFPDGGPDVIIDPLWGAPALAAMAAAPANARVVNLGQSAGAEISLPSAVVRGKRLHLIGHTVFRTPVEELAAAHRTLLEHVRAGRLQVDLEEYSLDQTPEAWDNQRSGPATKLVIRRRIGAGTNYSPSLCCHRIVTVYALEESESTRTVLA